ncbi:hypothetical protein LOTGIDRAFT_175955 [Lottia gigantea]|uniref:Uncharacterized protein n=1 Tax=Lottia gigantea TaxID=225164 RepID=V3ZXY1_LOTGI|nr:hypothetical protein LOTGIDRAFT_175955 [Lottia gigantea]ESO87485.1 hypothetical protein LOTGIDRAFT_175955 [Lottia gigantea]
MTPAKHFSYLADHEIAKMKQEEDNDDREITLEGFNNADNRILQAEKRAAWRQARMKSLEADAVKAQVVISRAQELKTDPSKNKANISSDLDIAFADDDDGHTQNGQPHTQFFSPSLRKHLIVERRDGETTVEERTNLIGENSRTITEEIIDEKTGKPTFRTVQVIEKTLERELIMKRIIKSSP